MQCKCTYFLVRDDGARVCSVCGKPAHSSKIEDKVVAEHETKIYPSESRRLKKRGKNERNKAR